ncbi:hypothetical protein FBEOM_1625 [Fusarium beomiforme]|uniref:Uncharacterized protein n=1 Tax=Fusarium beomiforme TaxID=44412 RepID=A0A9P5AT20_9HYPO|nr:hypothetical protein FBEOM_1625 [Fusarium beomiforme]
MTNLIEKQWEEGQDMGLKWKVADRYATASFGNLLRQEAVSIVLEAGKSLFSELTSSPAEPVECKQILSHYLFPKVLHFRLEGLEGKATIVPIAPSEAKRRVIIYPALERRSKETLYLLPDLERFTPEEVIVTKVLLGGAVDAIATVQVEDDKTEIFCKATGAPGGSAEAGLGRELETLGKILRVWPDPNVIRVPRLLGYIKHKETKQTLGFLRQWIPGRPLRIIKVADVKQETRQKRITQICDSVEQLYKNGIVWPASPHSIVIDDKDDAWLDRFESCIDGIHSRRIGKTRQIE